MVEGEALPGGAMAEADAGNKIMGAFWFGTFLSIADQRNFEFHLSDLDLSGMFTCQRTIILENLVDLHLCNLWIPMMLQRHSII